MFHVNHVNPLLRFIFGGLGHPGKKKEVTKFISHGQTGEKKSRCTHSPFYFSQRLHDVEMTLL